MLQEVSNIELLGGCEKLKQCLLVMEEVSSHLPTNLSYGRSVVTNLYIAVCGCIFEFELYWIQTTHPITYIIWSVSPFMLLVRVAQKQEVRWWSVYAEDPSLGFTCISISVFRAPMSLYLFW